MRASTAIAIPIFLATFMYAAEPPVPGVALDLARARAAAISDIHYKLSITLQEKAAAMPGHEVIEFNLANGGEVVLDFRDLTPAGAVTNGKVSHLRVNGRDTPPVQANGHLVIPVSYVKTGANRVELDFESDIAQANRAVTRSIDPVDGNEYLYSLFVPMDASLAFPCFDQPDLKARFTLEVNAPASWTVISNTREESVSPGVFRFPETRPLSTYQFAFAAGPFEQLPAPDGESSSVPMRLFVRKSALARAKEEWPEVARYTRQGIAYLSGFFQQPFPFPKYDQVLIPGFPYGGMEHAGATFLREDSVLFRAAPNLTDHQRRSVLVLHELSHQWFGDMVTMRWFDDLWLKEGFAQYMAFHALAELEPPAGVWKRFYESIKPIAYNIDGTPGTSPIYQKLGNLADAKSAYGPIVYQKAPSLLRVLNYKLGEAGFRDGVRIFLKEHSYANATWQDLIGAFSRASKQDLKPWADAWVTQRGMPVVTVQWACAAGKISDLRLFQKDSLNLGSLWPVSTELALGDATLPVSFTGAQTQVTQAIGKPCPDYVFANSGDHAYGRFLPDAKSAAAMQKSMGSVRDPLERALRWGALWDSVREAELAPATYVDLAVASLPSEADLDITQSILGRTATAIRSYLSDSMRDAAAAKFESLLADRMKTATERDFRIAYFRAFAGAASTGPSLLEVRRLLAGESSISGVPLQQRDRWSLISTLVRQGAADSAALVDTERVRDKSEDGKRSAYAALAGIATPANKKKYFDEYLQDGAVAEDFVTASLASFNARNQEVLNIAFVAPALDALPVLKRQRKIFFINGWLASFVAGHSSTEAQKAVDGYLSRNDIDPDLRLKVLEVKDDLDRTVRIRSRWK